jgi:hypothetical protein
MRVYVPATLATVAGLLDRGALPAGPATAVTDDLRAALPGADDEELELEALLDAAELSAELVLADASVARRRVVLAADVREDSVSLDPERGPAVVLLTEPVAFSAVVSAHVDEAGAEAAVEAGDVEDLDLLWYAAQELGDLVPR